MWARDASSVAVSERPSISAASIVARATSPTRAATSTMLAADIRNSTAARWRRASNHASARAEPSERDRAAGFREKSGPVWLLEHLMKRTSLRVDPISEYLERYRKGSRAYPVAI